MNIKTEWNFGKKACTHFSIEKHWIGVGIYGIALVYARFPFRIWPFKKCKVYWFEGDLVWQLFAEDSWIYPREEKLMFWQCGHFNPMNFIFGRLVHSKEDLGGADIMVPMPEGPYPARVEFERRTWRRKRWPWWPLTKTQSGSWVNCKIGIPFEGKGENSWDCGEDAVYACGSSETTTWGAAAHYTKTVLQNRERYGKAEPGAYPHPSKRAHPPRVCEEPK
jgi:hypothetical protein